MNIGCIICANGNDLPDGEYCRACGRQDATLTAAIDEMMKLEGTELDAKLQQMGFDPDELLALFNRAMAKPVTTSE